MDYIITTDLPNAEEFVKLRVDAEVVVFDLLKYHVRLC